MTQHAVPSPRGVYHRDCPARVVLDHVTNRWGTLIMCSLGEYGTLRFHALRDQIGGISEKMLSQNLRTLTRDGLVSREVEPSSPPRVSYTLTPLGVEFAARLQGLVHWITDHAADITAAQERHDAES